MTIDGQYVNYRNWMANDAFREAISGGTDNYFNSLNISAPAPGTETVGYRFVYIPKNAEDTAVSPFHYGTVNSLASGEVALAEGMMPTNNANTLKGINVDPTGRGFYYWPDREVAEDYMRAFVSRVSDFERKPVKSFYQVELRDEEVDYRELPYQGAKEDKSIPSQPRTLPGSTNVASVLTHHVYADKETAERARTRGLMSRPALRFDSQEGWVDDKRVYKVKNIHAIGAGKLALYRVSGIAKENTYGDAGFIMDEMQYSSEPVIEIPIDTIYPEFQAGTNK